MTATKVLTFVDTNVLIAAATGTGDVHSRAMAILDDPGRSFASSALVRLEALPKAIFHRKTDATEFYTTFFEAVQHWASDLNNVADTAFDEAVQFDIAARDALHVAGAAAVGAAELITAEKPTRPMFRTSTVTVRSIHPDAGT